MDPPRCRSVHGEELDVSLHKLRLVVERSLSKANLVGSEDVRVLQATVPYLLYLLCVCNSEQLRLEAAVVVCVAQRQRHPSTAKT